VVIVIRFVIQQYRHACRAGFGRRQALTRAIRAYKNGF
jgi:hypothetical protein